MRVMVSWGTKKALHEFGDWGLASGISDLPLSKHGTCPAVHVALKLNHIGGDGWGRDTKGDGMSS